jgi:hypothetical protein
VAGVQIAQLCDGERAVAVAARPAGVIDEQPAAATRALVDPEEQFASRDACGVAIQQGWAAGGSQAPVVNSW